jgi:hypothetical protein
LPASQGDIAELSIPLTPAFTLRERECVGCGSPHQQLMINVFDSTWAPFNLISFHSRLRGFEYQSISFSNPLTPALSLRERELNGTVVISIKQNHFNLASHSKTISPPLH